MAFARYHVTRTQPLPQCCKYLSDPLALYLLYINQVDVTHTRYVLNKTIQVDDDGFVVLQQVSVYFDLEFLETTSSPRDLDQYAQVTRPNMTEHDMRVYKLLLRDRWYKGDFVRLKKMMLQQDVSALLTFACNVLWERGYEDNYTLGQQLSIRITTKLIQSGLDFKHQQDSDNTDAVTVPGRGWNSKVLEKFIGSITSISDVIKRHKCSLKYIVIEIDLANCARVKVCLNEHFTVIDNAHTENICAIQLDDDKNSLQYLVKLSKLIADKIINVLFVTDVEFYVKQNDYLFYLYNSLKLYYYCLCNKFVFEFKDYEIIFLLNLIVSLEWHNRGHLNSFTLEKSQIYNPLELSTRRLNSIKRAATQSRVICNDNEIKIDFIKGKRMKMGTHYGPRLLQLE
ncbi:putative late expression factor [Mamestra configurata nucleopolyhedrovirus B]|uniref:p47 n=2 Tax=Alphabaculovirus TaxID=558016 RepID=J7HEL7_NPVMB|nr:putative late expression factor [Mamestra configurata nucleopolyhedrovirus B]AAM95130.1 putative late expression factor [Mamestra configurata nucleopolyhedrovirus B]AFP95858.1 p47 [Mamestra brassicae multiple nucleopolyhedrovirus]QNH90786.1 p47 [Mamestra configurata nucleopolyhedrovirus B]